LAPLGLELRPLGSAARSQLLYRLSYPYSQIRTIVSEKYAVTMNMAAVRSSEMLIPIYTPSHPGPSSQTQMNWVEFICSDRISVRLWHLPGWTEETHE
jgi:hypothetical protein